MILKLSLLSKSSVGNSIPIYKKLLILDCKSFKSNLIFLIAETVNLLKYNFLIVLID